MVSEDSDKREVRAYLEKIHQAAMVENDQYIIQCLGVINKTLDRMWEQQPPNKKIVKLFEETDIDGKPFDFD